MKTIGFPVLFMGLTAFAQAAFAEDELELHCPGSGSVTNVENSTVVARDSDRNRSTAVVQSHDTRRFEGAVDVKVGTRNATIRIPPGMYPSFWVSEKGEWMEIAKLKTSDREITGEFKLTLLTKPDIRIDRVTGEITVSSSSINFTGACAKVDTQAAPKF